MTVRQAAEAVLLEADPLIMTELTWESCNEAAGLATTPGQLLMPLTGCFGITSGAFPGMGRGDDALPESTS